MTSSYWQVVTGNAGVFVWVFFKVAVIPMSTEREPQYCRHGKSRQLGWPLTSGVNLQLSLCR